MAFHSPGQENQSKNGSNPYAKGGAGATAPKPGQKPNKGKKGKKGAKGDQAAPKANVNKAQGAQAGAKKAAAGVQGSTSADPKKTAVVRKKKSGPTVGKDGRVFEERSIMHIDPMSALKVGFLLSACLFAVWIIAALVVYMGLGMAGVWDKINGLIGDLTGSGEFGFGTYFGIVFALGLMELVVLTLLAPVAAVAYNASAQLLGGLRIKLDN